jgi:hypothetical protein
MHFDVESPSSQDSSIDKIDSIRGSHDDYPIGGRKSVHLTEKLRDS